MNTTPQLLPQDLKDQIDHWVAKFPAGKQQSAVIMALRLLQKKQGYLADDMLDAVADYLDIPRINVYKVASFYSMYERKPCGKHKFAVCNSIACALKGSRELIDDLKTHLDIELGGTTADGLITLKETECLGACANAPVAVLDEDQYQEDLTTEKCSKIFDDLAKQQEDAS